ncbi:MULTISPECIES: NAD-dependent deacylase [Pseudomonas]|uniref:protein acetyllysine N-acetyltransferase n=1 Tax=Pseudomonas spirodelae TaxID=3101751 RepID=A0ABU5PEQ9_9PSED|nr:MULTISPECIES: NAD-dependent deacylase [unclassified Pseudomonas]MBU0901740.1 NAD-dependent deacylase [Gammaproteobacteria bacterium]MDD2161596.1 NAD-dependent deacylase [Pseudomonas sp. MIL19]MEA1607995.1 NAD-dependent deacylase [Pseudomonas sp. T5W1]
MEQAIKRVAEELKQAERILLITGAGLSADSGLPTYRGLGGLYNGQTAEGLPIETALSGPMLQRDPALCWKYLAELGKACLGAQANAGHYAIAELQRRKPHCWLLTQNIDGYHRAAGSPMERVIEIHGELAPLYCQSCGAVDAELAAHLQRPLPPKCRQCAGILRPPVVLFGEMLPEQAIASLYAELGKGFDVVISVGTSASFPYIVEPLLRTRQAGGFTADINPQRSDLSNRVDVHLQGRALDVLPELLSHI